MRRQAAFLLLALVAGEAALAHAHTTGRAFILLLPTDLYIVGGALAVAASFVLMALIPSGKLARVERVRTRVWVTSPSGAPRWVLTVCPSLLSLLVVTALVWAGDRGSRDPLSNPLPLFVWSVWWVGLTYLHALFGNLWAYVNPWTGLYRLLTALPSLRRWREAPPLAYPRSAGYWPALLLFLAFAWFELIHPAPSDPARLARVVSAYLLVNFLGIVLFGDRAWLQYVEAFSVFFRVISWLSPLSARNLEGHCGTCAMECRAARNCLNCRECLGGDAPKEVEITVPTLNLLSVSPLRPSGVAFVLLALSSVSFDGLSRTFSWLDVIGVNPLEYPGRTVLMAWNTTGLFGVFAALALAYAVVVFAAKALAGPQADVEGLDRVFVLSIVPIAFGYHFAHYLPAFLVDVQYALRSVSDPLGLGWNLFGTGDRPIITALLSDPDRVYAVWNTQVAIIVSAHIAAVSIAHVLALRLTPSPSAAILSQIPMTLLMIGYTMFGLWLLSTPSIG